MINEDIKNSMVVLVGDNGNYRETQRNEALDIAFEQGLDLVQVAEKDGKSVCKLMEYSKFVYEQNKKSKHREKGVDTKEIKMTWKISEHDLKVKLNNAERILTKDHDKVKFTVVFRGREARLIEEGKKLLANIQESLVELDIKCSNIKVEGINVTMIAEPKK